MGDFILFLPDCKIWNQLYKTHPKFSNMTANFKLKFFWKPLYIVELQWIDSGDSYYWKIQS